MTLIQLVLNRTHCSGGAVFGRIGLGILSDKVSPWLLAIYALLFSSVATFLLWGVAGGATSGVLIYGILYGLVAGGWTSLWNGFVKPLSSASSHTSLLDTAHLSEQMVTARKRHPFTAFYCSREDWEMCYPHRYPTRWRTRQFVRPPEFILALT